MTDFRDRYKRLGFDLEANRALRSQRRDEARRGFRDEQMSLRREMDASDEDDSRLLNEDATASTQESGFSANSKSTDSHDDTKNKAAAEYEAAVQQRWERLQKWREEKNKRKQIEKKKAKPVFKVGVVHHRVYSPPVNKEPAAAPAAKLCRSRDLSANMSQAPSKRVTRATEKRMAVKTLVNQQKRENLRSKKKAQPKLGNASNQDDQVEIAPKDHVFKAPQGLTPMPIFGRQALQATRANIQAEIDSFQIAATSSNAACSESFNESAASLKLSDDQEMPTTSEARSPVSRRSSKTLSPPVADEANVKGVDPNVEEMMQLQQYSRTETRSVDFSSQETTENNKKQSAKDDSSTPSRKRKSVVEHQVDSPRRTRSTRVADKRRSMRIASTDSADSGIEPSLTGDEPTKVLESAVADSDVDSILNADKHDEPASSRRRSTKSQSSRRCSKLMASKSMVNQATNRRTSLNSSSIVTFADIHHSPMANQESNAPIESPPSKKSTLELNSTNLMDFTFSAPAKLAKLTDPPNTLLDDSVVNVSPRGPPTTVSTGNPEEDQPLIRFSSFYVPTPANQSSSSEPTKQTSPNEIMNLSLNISLPKESEEARPPAFFSPYIVQSRGKNSARKEMKKRRFSQPGLEAEDIPTKDNIMQKLHISVEEEERTAQYYKHVLDQEIERLNELCDRWNLIKEDAETPEETRYIIQAACGQTQLLINKKFERFRSLVKDCETGRGEMLVTCKDLQGFWDMMYMEINNCEGRFNNLEEMKANNWLAKEDEAIIKEAEKKTKKVAVKKPVTKKAAVGKPSSLRAMIAAARKKKAQAEDGGEGSEKVTIESGEKPSSPSKTNSRRTSTPKSANKWDNLLKKVQLSQTRKSTTSPLVVMKLGQMVKTPEVQLDDSIVYINSGRTPAKSILKKDEVMGSVSKSTNKVFFREQSNEVKEFENMSLEEPKEPIERKLNFEDDSFVENAEDNDRAVTATTSPMISMSPLSLQDKTKKKSAKSKKQISFKEDHSNESEPRRLRARKFSAPLTPIPKPSNKEQDMSVDVDDDVSAGNYDKEIYLNEHGVVCERYVPIKKATPGRSLIRKSNSQVHAVTPRLRRQNASVPGIQINTPKGSVSQLSDERDSLTPLATKQSLKRSFADVTLTQDNADMSVEEAATPKPTPKAKAKSELKRTRSLKDTNNEESNAKQKKDFEEEALKRKSSEKLQENIEPNQQETDGTPKRKLSKTASLRRKSLKRQAETIDPSEILTDVSDRVSDTVAENSRRKSLRITRASIRNEN